MKAKVETVLNLSKDLRAKEVAKLKPEELEVFATELRNTAIDKGLKLPSIVIEAAKIRTMVAAGLEGNDELSEQEKVTEIEIKVKDRLIISINQLLKLFPEMVLEQKLALDREFEDQRDRLNAIIDDLNKGRLPESRYHELVHENYHEEGVKSRTFLAYALQNNKLAKLVFFLEVLKKSLGDKEFDSYMNTPNYLSYLATSKEVSVSDFYLENYGKLNEERNLISKDNEKILKKYTPKKEVGRRIVDINSVDTHNVSSHKSGDEAHVGAFKMMVEAENLSVTASYTKPVKASDPSREVKITDKGNLDEFVASKLGELKKDVDNLLKMNDEELYDNYVRHNDIEKFKSIEYKDLAATDKTGIDKKIKGLRFKAGAAQRYMDNMLNDHKCDSGAYKYKTNDASTCGLNMEQMVATSYWASKDKANFKSADVSEKGNFLSLIDQLYDMRRGYDIDSGTDKPDELVFPANPGRDNNRCHGGGVNSLSWALATVHKAYNPVKIERSDIENDLTKIYSQIVEDNFEYIKKIATPNELMIWSSTKRITGNLRKNLEEIFHNKYQEGFVNYYKGYIADDTFYSVLDKGLDNIAIPEMLKTQYAIEAMDGEAIYQAIANEMLPLIHFDRTRGYESTLNYLSSLPGKETLIEGLAVWAIANQNEPSARTVLTFLSRSKLAEEYKDYEVISINGKPITLGDIASLNAKELEVLCTGKAEEIVETCIEKSYNNLLNLYALKVGFTNAELSKGYGPDNLTPLHMAVSSGKVDIVEAILATPGIDIQKLLDAKDNLRNTALHYAAYAGKVDIVKAILATPGTDIKKLDIQKLLDAKDKEGKTPLHDAAYSGKVDIVEAILATPGIDIQKLLDAKDKEGKTPMHYAAYKGRVDTVKVILATPGTDIKKLLDAKNHHNQTPMHLAVYSGKVDIVEAILATPGTDIKKLDIQKLLDAEDDSGKTPLHLAAQYGKLDIVKAILATPGTDIKKLLDAKNHHNQTPMHLAVYSGKVDIVEAILATPGADIKKLLDAKDKEGKTPMHYAVNSGKVDIVKILKEAETGLLSNLLPSLMSAPTSNPLATTSLSGSANPQSLNFSSILWETCVEFSHTISMSAVFEDSYTNKINQTSNPLATTSLSWSANPQSLNFSSILWETCVEFSHAISMSAVFEDSYTNKRNQTDDNIVR